MQVSRERLLPIQAEVNLKNIDQRLVQLDPNNWVEIGVQNINTPYQLLKQEPSVPFDFPQDQSHLREQLWNKFLEENPRSYSRGHNLWNVVHNGGTNLVVRPAAFKDYAVSINPYLQRILTEHQLCRVVAVDSIVVSVDQLFFLFGRSGEVALKGLQNSLGGFIEAKDLEDDYDPYEVAYRCLIREAEEELTLSSREIAQVTQLGVTKAMGGAMYSIAHLMELSITASELMSRRSHFREIGDVTIYPYSPEGLRTATLDHVGNFLPTTAGGLVYAARHQSNRAAEEVIAILENSD